MTIRETPGLLNDCKAFTDGAWNRRTVHIIIEVRQISFTVAYQTVFFFRRIRASLELLPYTVRTLCGNIYLNRDYVFDTLMEPLFWLVDNFAKAIGPVSNAHILLTLAPVFFF